MLTFNTGGQKDAETTRCDARLGSTLHDLLDESWKHSPLSSSLPRSTRTKQKHSEQCQVMRCVFLAIRTFSNAWRSVWPAFVSDLAGSQVPKDCSR